MQVGKLDHINLRTHRLDQMVEWYGRVLGMPSGWRPNFPFPGAWLYADGVPVVHLNGCDRVAEQLPDLTMEHFALQAKGLKELVARLERDGERFAVAAVPGAPIVQVNLWDPDGNHVHIDFAATEAEGVKLPNQVTFGPGGKLIPVA